MFGNKNVRAARKAVKRLDVAAFNTALAAIPEDRKQGVIDEALYYIVQRDAKAGSEALITALLKAGAEVNQQTPGIILACAIVSNHSTAVVKLIHDKGCNFDDALIIMRHWGADSLKKLKDKRQEITGSRERIVPPSEEEKFQAQVLEKLDGIAAQFNDVSERLARLEEAAGLGERAPPQKAARAMRTTPINLS